MKHYNIEELQSEWYVGDFEPTHRWPGGEVAMCKYPKNTIEMSFYHENAIKYYAVLQGKIKINERVLEKGKIAEIAAKEKAVLIALEDSVVLKVVVGNRKCDRFHINSLQEIENIYAPIFELPRYKKANIKFDEISVVVQGAIETITPMCLESIRRFLPGSKIILSTWEGMKLDGCDYDEVILGKDPGGYSYTREMISRELVNNVNRQLVSIQNGLQKVTTKYTLKLRTDMVLLSNSFLDYFGMYSKRISKYEMFEHKVLIADFYTRHMLKCPKGYIHTPFHISDWFFFGLTKDINKYFEGTRLMTKDEVVNYSEVKNPYRREKYGYCFNWKFSPEQHYAVQAIQRNFPNIRMNDWSDWDETLVKQSEQIIMNNFIVLDFLRHGICIPKYDLILTSNYGDGMVKEKGLYTFDIYCKYYESIFEGKNNFDEWDAK